MLRQSFSGPLSLGNDISAVGTFDKIVDRLRRDGHEVEVIGYNDASADIVDRFALHDMTGFELGVVPH